MTRIFAISLLAAALAVGPGAAETPKPFPEFSAKRVKVGKQPIGCLLYTSPSPRDS